MKKQKYEQTKGSGVAASKEYQGYQKQEYRKDVKFDRNNQQNTDQQLKNHSFRKPELTIQSFCDRAIESLPFQASYFTTRQQVESLWRESQKQEFSFFNFALGKLYLDNPKFFIEFFQEEDLTKLLNATEYKTDQYTKFLHNFVLACSLLVDTNNPEQLIYFSKALLLFDKTRKSLERQQHQASNPNEELHNKQLVVEQTLMILRMTHLKTENEKFHEFINTFLPSYIESVLKDHQILSSATLSPSETILALLYFLLKKQVNDPTADSSLQAWLSLIDTTDAQAGIQFVKGYSFLLVSNTPILSQYGGILNPIFDSYIKLLAEKQLADTKDIIDEFLNNQTYTPIQLKSLFYSIGKNSFMSLNVSKFLLQHLRDKSLDEAIKLKRADQHLSNLILASSNLRLLGKQEITPSLIQKIFEVAKNNLKNEQNLSAYLLAVGISFLRMGYYQLEFWGPFFKIFPLKKDSYFLQLLLEVAPVLYVEMPSAVSALFQEAIQCYQTIEKVGQQTPQEVKPSVLDLKVKQYLEEKNIPFSQNVTSNKTNFKHI